MTLESRLKTLENEVAKLKMRNHMFLIVLLMISGICLSQAQISDATSTSKNKNSDISKRIALLENRVKSLEKEVYVSGGPKSPSSVEDRLAVLEDDVRKLYSSPQ